MSNLVTHSGLLIAKDFDRLVEGGRGNYVEINNSQIVKENLHNPDGSGWRISNSFAYYSECRSNCESNIKIYYQKRTVDYADYKVGYWYIYYKDIDILW